METADVEDTILEHWPYIEKDLKKFLGNPNSWAISEIKSNCEEQLKSARMNRDLIDNIVKVTQVLEMVKETGYQPRNS